MRSAWLAIVLFVAGAAQGATLLVHPGESIQAAVDLAHPGDTVRVLAGTYHEPGRPCPRDASRTCAVVVSTDRVRLVAADHFTNHQTVDVILVNPGGQDDGITLARSLSDPTPDAPLTHVVVQGFGVTNFAGAGIATYRLERSLLKNNVIGNNAYAGILAIESGQGTKYIRNSIQVVDLILYPLLTPPRVGIRVEGGSGARFDHNFVDLSYIGVFAHGVSGMRFTNLGVDGARDGVVLLDVDNPATGNYVTRTFIVSPTSLTPVVPCSDSADVACTLPTGVGILLLSSDRTVVFKSEVDGGFAAGILVANWCATFMPPGCALSGPDPDGNAITANYLPMGSTPDPSIPPALTGFGLSWDGTGAGNCWAKNNSLSGSAPATLPVCH